MPQGIDLLLSRALEQFKETDYRPPEALMDRPNITEFPVLEVSHPIIPGSVGSPMGELALQLSEQFMGEMGMPSEGGIPLRPEGMMGGVDAMGMMMEPGAPQGPSPGPLPEEMMPLPGDE